MPGAFNAGRSAYAARWRNLRYHWRTAPWSLLRQTQRALSGSARLPWLSLLKASWRHGASFDDYYALRWYVQPEARRRQLLTRSRLYELESQRNDPEQALITRDKLAFARHFADLIGRPVWGWQDLLALPDTYPLPGRLVIKHRFAGFGQRVLFPAQPFVDLPALRDFIRQLGEPENWLCEPYLSQHPDLAALHPPSLNTLSAVTVQQGGTVSIWYLMLHIGVGSALDNFYQGGLGALVNPDTGRCEAAQYLYPGQPDCTHHPLTGQPIAGLALPHLPAVRELLALAARRLPGVCCLSWDIALTPEGPCLIEANERWSTLAQAFPGGQPLRPLAEPLCELRRVYD